MMSIFNGDFLYFIVGLLTGIFAGTGWGYSAGLSKITGFIVESDNEKR